MNTKRFAQIFAGQLDWVDMGAKILQQPERLRDGSGHFGIDGSIWRLSPQSDSRAFESVFPQHKRRQLADALVPVLDIAPGYHAEHGGGIFRRTAYRADMRNSAEGARRIGRNPTEGRLQSDHPCQRTWNPDRAAAVIAVVERGEAGRGGRRCAARGTARRMAEVPWIARDALQRRVGQRRPAELRRRRLAEDDGARGAQARDHDVVGGGNLAALKSLASQAETQLEQESKIRDGLGQLQAEIKRREQQQG